MNKLQWRETPIRFSSLVKNFLSGFFDWTYDMFSLVKEIVWPIGLPHVSERQFLHHAALE